MGDVYSGRGGMSGVYSGRGEMSGVYSGRGGMSDIYSGRGGMSGVYNGRGEMSGVYSGRGGMSGVYSGRGEMSGVYSGILKKWRMSRSWNECSFRYTCDGICMVYTHVIRLFTERQLQNGLAVPHCIVNTVIPVSVHSSEIFVIIAITSCFKMKTWYNAILNDG